MSGIIRYTLLLVLVLVSFVRCKDAVPSTEVTANTGYIHRAVDKTTEIIIHDIFSPVVAARIYAYSSIALYETLRQLRPEFLSLAGQVRDLTDVPAAPNDPNLDLNLAGLQAYMTVAKALIFSEQEMEDFRTTIYDEIRAKGVSEDVFKSSLAYGDAVAAHILAWSKKDNYAQTRSFPKFTVSKDPNRWQPTPPAYIEAIEPDWNKIRPMTLDSAGQFKPAPPAEFSTDTTSEFYKLAREVHNALDEDKENRLAIANFWDCNPYVMHQEGHLMFATKKITPGGHWVGITGLVTRKTGQDMAATAEAYALVSIGLFDGFISCWDEKYRSNLVRPETYINRNIDSKWEPALQTPPFPEHTSGHSVISNASNVILTKIFGDNFAFDDSTEVAYQLPVRSFKSFQEAADEASISRFYGGIHYMPAIEEGVTQGVKVGQHVLSRIQTRKTAE